MAKNSQEAYGAASRTNLLMFDPATLTLVTDEKHPLYDERVHKPIDPAFVANIDTFGVKQAIGVRKNPETDKIEVVWGRQRVKAAVEVNKIRKKRGDLPIQVPAVVQRGEDVSLMSSQALENAARSDPTPMERAKHMQRMMGRGATVEQVCMAYACSEATVRNAVAILEAPAAVRKLVESGGTTYANGAKLARMPAAEAKKKAAEIEAQAPRTPGKRNGSASKAREIIDGPKKRPRAKAAGDATQAGEPTIYLRQVAAMQDTTQENLHIAGEFKRYIIACLKALQGDPVEWNEILFPKEI